jgi:hypothetical protein
MEIPKKVGKVRIIVASSPEEFESKMNELVTGLRVRY